ncbi:MAG: sugar transporter ATP-binding protein [Conexibacter sp.]|nr:sugar transporter ATP-binding protein [Conexibacter sp.]
MPSPAPVGPKPLIEARGVVKQFGGELALANVALDLREGEIHALLGQNGAGKSTLIKVLAGVVQRDAGEVTVNGHELPQHVTAAAVAGAGLAFVHQDLGLLDHLSVAENIALAVGYERRRGLISFAATVRRVKQLLDDMGLEIDPRQQVGSLRQDEKVMVATCRAFSMQARAIVLDEISSSLPAPDVERLADALRASAARGIGYVFVTHRLDEVFGLADRITVLRDGRCVMTCAVAETTYDDVVDKIVGTGERPVRRAVRRQPVARDRPRLDVRGLTGRGLDGAVSFDVAPGEIVALCGLVGCGARELAGILGGALPPSGGQALIDGAPMPLGAPRDLRDAGCTYVPGDRQNEGGVAGMSIRENLFLIRTEGEGALRRRGPERRQALGLAERFDVRPREDPERPLATLSGGNQQKVIVGRALRADPRLLVVDDPTAGVDVGARAQIHTILRDSVQRGGAVVMASSDFDEVAQEADRALVMVRGRVHAELSGDDLTPERLAQASYARGGIVSTIQEEQFQ